jgi:hypothetical protein
VLCGRSPKDDPLQSRDRSKLSARIRPATRITSGAGLRSTAVRVCEPPRQGHWRQRLPRVRNASQNATGSVLAPGSTASPLSRKSPARVAAKCVCSGEPCAARVAPSQIIWRSHIPQSVGSVLSNASPRFMFGAFKGGVHPEAAQSMEKWPAAIAGASVGAVGTALAPAHLRFHERPRTLSASNAPSSADRCCG